MQLAGVAPRARRPGKLADFVALSDNPMTVGPGALAEVKAVETIKEGASVHRA